MNGPGLPPTVEARRLIRTADRVAMATVMRGGATVPEIWPYASLALVASDHAGCPLLLISDLADHTKNLRVDRRVSLLFDGTAGFDEPLTGPRATIAGEATPVDDPRLLARYLARHPAAADWAGFTDFHLWRVSVMKVHLVVGFGKIHWLEGPEVLFDPGASEELAATEPDIIAHMNTGHAGALDLIAGRLLHAVGDGWSMTGIDPEGFDLRRAGRFIRLEFAEFGIDAPLRDAADARAALAGLAGKARQRQAPRKPL